MTEPKRIHCEECRSWEPNPNGKEDRRSGICHRAPPVGSEPSKTNATFWCDEGEPRKT